MIFEKSEFSDSIHLQEMRSNVLAVLDASGNLTFWDSSRFVTALALDYPIKHTLQDQTSALIFAIDRSEICEKA